MSINLQKVIIAVCAAATVSAGFAARTEGAKPVSYTHLTLPTILLV